MSAKKCNFCKEIGHSIYTDGPNARLVLQCPVLIQKEQSNKKKADADFPPLGGVSSSDTTDWTASFAIGRGIYTVLKEQKHKEWQKRNADKKEKQRSWVEYYKVRMHTKYGPRWHWQVQDTSDDSSYAVGLRYDEERENNRIEDENELRNDMARAEYEAKELERNKERQAIRARMTSDERYDDDQAEYEEMNNSMWDDCVLYEHQYRAGEKRKMREHEEYEKNGWPWPPRR